MSQLPNIDISQWLEWGWEALQFSARWTVVLCLLVFILVLLAGAGDILGDIVKSWKAKRRDKPPRRMSE